LKRKFVISIFLILICIFSISTLLYAKEIKITAENLNVRTGPGTNYETIGQVQPEDVYPVLEENGEWVQIQLDEDVTGWVHKLYTSSVTNEKNEKTTDVNQQIIAKEPKKHQSFSPLHLQGKTIVIDPGHGGRDVGAIGVSGRYESEYTLRTAQLLKQNLEQHGAIVYLTREDDRYLPLVSRVSLSNQLATDVFISIHYNSTPELPEVTGVGTFYYNDRDKELASFVQEGIINQTNMNNREIRQADLQVLRTNHQHGLLLELGFISNESEEKNIQKQVVQKAFARGIVEGLQKFFLNAPR
jgi:N-acetylmuramoyl-L-alanine amidase